MEADCRSPIPGTIATSVLVDPVNEMRETEPARLRALVANAMATAEAFHAQSFHLVTPHGSTLTRFEYLDAVENGRIMYRAWKITSE